MKSSAFHWCVAVLWSTLATVALAGEAPVLFTSVREDPNPLADRFLASYQVEVNLEAVLLPAESVTLNIPGEQPERVELKHWEPRAGYIQIEDPENPLLSLTIPDPNARPEDFSWRWYGRSERHRLAMTLVNGALAGRVAGAERRYAIQGDGRGHTFLRVLNSAYWKTHPEDGNRPEAAAWHPPLSMPESVSIIGAASSPSPTRAISSAGSSRPAGPGWDTACTAPLPEGTQVIDVLLLYTRGTLLNYSGSVSDTHAGLLMAIDDANQAMRDSGIQGVVFSPRGPEFLPDESGPDFLYDQVSITAAYDRLAGISRIGSYPYFTFPGNAYVAGRRDTQWADIVALARRDLSAAPVPSCGVSHVNRWVVSNGYPREPGPAFDPLAYLVFDPECAADRLNLAHELGHQLGMEHDPTNYEAHSTAGNMPSCPWSFGHKRSTGDARFRFRTVMAYWQNYYSGPAGPTGCGNDLNCPQIDAYSTPALEWAGDAAGGGTPPFGLQWVGTVPGASPIGIALATALQRRANATDTIKRIAPLVEVYRARPDGIFAHGFE